MEVKDKETFFLFIRNKEDNSIDFIGPLFDDEIEECKVEYFGNRKDVESLNEETFKVIYSDDYYIDFNLNWADYIACFLEKMDFDFDIVLITSDENDISKENDEFKLDFSDDIILIYDLCAIKKEENNICIQFNIESNAFDAADLILQLSKYCEGFLNIILIQNTLEEVDLFYKEKLKDIYVN